MMLPERSYPHSGDGFFHGVCSSVEFLEESDDLWDIEVADNHNFFVSDADTIKLLVHNCATDVVSILHIADCQVDRARYKDINGKPYHKMFQRHMQYQMSDTVHVLSHLKQDGSLINKKYLRSLLRPDSVLAKAIADLMDEFKTFPEVMEANKALLGDSGFKAKSLFSSSSKNEDRWVFSFTKAAHKIKLFIKVCRLKAVSQTATGADAIDKEFIEHYKDRNYLVAKFGEYQEATKLLTTYIRGWYKKLTREIDGATDDHLRPDYKFFDVDTGRLASGGPNLQNVPTRGKLSKIIKEMFVTADGCLQIRFDYSAHEVRGWSIAAGDTVLAQAFKVGQKLRQKFIAALTNPVDAELKKRGWKLPLDKDSRKELEKDIARRPKNLAVLKALLIADDVIKELKQKGDIHIQNVFRFFGRWVDKSDPLRDAIKAVVFGVLYGKSAATLGNDTKRTDLDAAKAKINEAYKSGDKKKLAACVAEFERILEEDRSEAAQEIIDKMFQEFKRGDQWVKRMQHMATEKFYVFSPIGRIRHLYAAMTGMRQIIGRQVRRGMNAPIQGFASEIAVKASRRVMTSFYRDREKIDRLLGREPSAPIKFNRIVHDALYFTVPYSMVIPFLHILQYESTYGVARAYEKEFGLKFTVEPEIEVEIGCKDTLSHKWDWSLPALRKIIETSVDEGIANKLLTQPREEILEEIFAPWRNKKTLKYLDDNYPLLNVSLAKEIEDVCK